MPYLVVYSAEQVWTTTDQRSMNTASVSSSTSSLPCPATTTSRLEWEPKIFPAFSHFNTSETEVLHTCESVKQTQALKSGLAFLCPKVIASVLMLTREISDNKTLTIKSSYHTEYQQPSNEWTTTTLSHSIELHKEPNKLMLLLSHLSHSVLIHSSRHPWFPARVAGLSSGGLWP